MKSFHEYVEMRDDYNVDESMFGGLVGAAGAAAQGLGSGLLGAGKAALRGAGSVGKAALNLGDKAISATAQPVIQGAKDFARGTADAYSKIDINRLNDIMNKSTDPAFKLLMGSIVKNYDKNYKAAKDHLDKQQQTAQAKSAGASRPGMNKGIQSSADDYFTNAAKGRPAAAPAARGSAPAPSNISFSKGVSTGAEQMPQQGRVAR